MRALQHHGDEPEHQGDEPELQAWRFLIFKPLAPQGFFPTDCGCLPREFATIMVFSPRYEALPAGLGVSGRVFRTEKLLECPEN